MSATLVQDGLAVLDGADAPAPLAVDLWLDGILGESLAEARVAISRAQAVATVALDGTTFDEEEFAGGCSGTPAEDLVC